MVETPWMRRRHEADDSTSRTCDAEFIAARRVFGWFQLRSAKPNDKSSALAVFAAVCWPMESIAKGIV
jgi:hypothetical protein